MTAAHAELERSYRRLLRLYPREFRARHADGMLDVLLAAAADGQRTPARCDVADIARGALRERLRGPRGGWPLALAAFALVAPLFLVLTDILQVAFPYRESQAELQGRIGYVAAHGTPAGDIAQYMLVRQHDGGLQLLGEPAFLLLAAGHLVVAVAVLAGLRRTALAALVIALAADVTQWNSLGMLHPGVGTIAFLTFAAFLPEAVVLAVADPRAARCAACRRLVFPVAALAAATQLWTLKFDASRAGTLMFAGGPTMSSARAALPTGLALVALAVLLPLPLALGWRTSVLLATNSYPLVLLAATIIVPHKSPLVRLLSAAGTKPPAVAHTEILAILFLPSLLVLCWAAARALQHGQAQPSVGGSRHRPVT